MAVAGPLEQFVIKDLIPINVAGVDLSFTNAALWMVIAGVVTSVGLSLAVRHKAVIPGRFQMLAENTYGLVANMVRENAGKNGMAFFPFIFTMFCVVLMGNMLGMIPGAFTYTSQLAVTGALALFLFVFFTGVGFYKHGLKFFGYFSPAGVPLALRFVIVPLEIISYMTRPLTLSMRLFANMMAGHLVLKVFAGFCVSLMSLSVVASIIPMGFNAVMIAFEFVIAFLQAYVFAILSCIYLHDALEMH